MKHSPNYTALLILRKALELHIEVDPSENQYGCTSLGLAADSIEDSYDTGAGSHSASAYQIAACANYEAFRAGYELNGIHWRNEWAYLTPANVKPGFSTADLRQYRIANFYRAIDLQERRVAAELLERSLKYYIEVRVPDRRAGGSTEDMMGFCVCIDYALNDHDLIQLAEKYWDKAERWRTTAKGAWWFNTVQERIDAATKLINELKGN